jgi:DNA-binding NtrC family response regulator
MYQNELFGYKKGSFTGADEDRDGLLKKAEGGDLFLDEIAELNADVQAGLLRLLETREYSPNGAPEERVELKDIRFLSATNADLAIRVGRGDFREDLYHRLREFAEEVYLPPLRERPSDIPCLTEHFVRKFEREFAARSREVTKGALEVLGRYPWPGNVRELRNYLYVAIARYDQAEYLSPAHLPEVLRNYAGKTWEADLVDGDASGRGPKASIASVLLDVERQLKDSAGLDAKRLALYVKTALDAFLAESRCKSEK